MFYALAELSKDLLEPHPADRMEAAIATEASVCVCFQGGYRGVGAMAIWTLFGVAYNCFMDCQGVASTTPSDRLRIEIPQSSLQRFPRIMRLAENY